MIPALYLTRIRHVRTEPVHNDFSYRGYSWFVDVDALPRLPFWLRPFGTFRADDHLEPPERELGARVRALLERNDIRLGRGRITALLDARVLGYVFSPLSLFWCHAESGELACVVAEVHNTYGQRHAYVLDTDGRARATTEKRFYVSPFNDVSGEYTLTVPEPADRLDVRIVLRRDQHAPFVATVSGTRIPATTANIARMQWRHPAAPLAVSLRIRRQGIGLWARGLPVQPRGAVRQEVT